MWCWFRLPESKDRTFGELDLLFENRVPARKFKKTKVDRTFPLAGRSSAYSIAHATSFQSLSVFMTGPRAIYRLRLETKRTLT